MYDNVFNSLYVAFTAEGISLTEEPLSTPQQSSEDHPTVSRRILHYRPLEELVPAPVSTEGAPRRPDVVYFPKGLDQLNTLFSHLLSKACDVVFELPKSKRFSLKKFLGSLMKSHTFGPECHIISDDPYELAEIVTHDSQDFINYNVLRESVRQIRNEDLQKVLEEYEEKLKCHREKVLGEVEVDTRVLNLEQSNILIRIGHPEKSRDELKMDLVIRERDLLVQGLKIGRVRFEGFMWGSVYLYYSVPEESVFLLFQLIEMNVFKLKGWGATEIIAYDNFTFDLRTATFTSWRPVSTTIDHIRKSSNISCIYIQ